MPVAIATLRAMRFATVWGIAFLLSLTLSFLTGLGAAAAFAGDDVG